MLINRCSQVVTRIAFAVVTLSVSAVPALAEFRFVTYNVTSSGGTPRSGLQEILNGISAESINGVSRPIDLISLQEIKSQQTTGAAVASLLGSNYAFATVNGESTGSGTQGVVYNTSTLQLLSESTVGIASTAGQPRQTLRYEFHPIGYSSAADFYIYSAHWKSADDGASMARRLTEATAIRADADSLGQGAQILYTGDFNTYKSTDAGLTELMSPGNGRAVDPINLLANWHDNPDPTIVRYDTQAPAVSPPAGLTGGGLDDRFDFQLLSDELTDGQGLEYVSGSYHAFGNNGSVPLNGSINSQSSTALASLSDGRSILDALTTVSDHLPVVADYEVVPEPASFGIVIALSAMFVGRRTRMLSR